MALAMQPSVALRCIGVFILVLYFTRFVSLSSIFAGLAFMILILFIYNEQELWYRIFAVLVAVMIVFTHQKNIARLLSGTESKVPIFKNRDKKRKKE